MWGVLGQCVDPIHHILSTLYCIMHFQYYPLISCCYKLHLQLSCTPLPLSSYCLFPLSSKPHFSLSHPVSINLIHFLSTLSFFPQWAYCILSSVSSCASLSLSISFPLKCRCELHGTLAVGLWMAAALIRSCRPSFWPGHIYSSRDGSTWQEGSLLISPLLPARSSHGTFQSFCQSFKFLFFPRKHSSRKPQDIPKVSP